MYIQYCVKGISGSNGFTFQNAISIIQNSSGIVSNLFRNQNTINLRQVSQELTDHNLDRHLHDYDNYRNNTPFISLACGGVERTRWKNTIYSAIDTALEFATDFGRCSGALFYLWVPVGHNKAVQVSTVAEPVRDLNIYRRWSPYQLEGEVAAKIHIPANQIEKVEWWNSSGNKPFKIDEWKNTAFFDPEPLSNIRNYF